MSYLLPRKDTLRRRMWEPCRILFLAPARSALSLCLSTSSTSASTSTSSSLSTDRRWPFAERRCRWTGSWPTWTRTTFVVSLPLCVAFSPPSRDADVRVAVDAAPPVWRKWEMRQSLQIRDWNALDHLHFTTILDTWTPYRSIYHLIINLVRKLNLLKKKLDDPKVSKQTITKISLRGSLCKSPSAAKFYIKRVRGSTS